MSIYKHTHIQAYIQTHTYMFIRMHACMHYKHAYIHYITLHYITLHYIHYIHTYITLHYITYIHTYIPLRSSLESRPDPRAEAAEQLRSAGLAKNRLPA